MKIQKNRQMQSRGQVDLSPTQKAKKEMLINLLKKSSREVAYRESGLESRLQHTQNGFHLGIDERMSCKICGDLTSGEDSWYDKNGIKCMSCQAAIDQKIVPMMLISKQNIFYTIVDLERYFKLKRAAIKQWIKAGVVKSRTIPGLGRKPDLLILMMADNKGFFPPKKMLQYVTVRVEIEDQVIKSTLVPWYKAYEPGVYLKKYGIAKYLFDGNEWL